MGTVSIDVAKESTLQNIYSKVKGGTGIWCNPLKSTDENGITMGDFGIGSSMTSYGLMDQYSRGCSIVNFRNDIYVLRVYGVGQKAVPVLVKIGQGPNCIEKTIPVPFSTCKDNGFSTREIPIVVYNDEIHVLGGSYSTSDTNVGDTHYAWNGTEWRVASTIPYPFRTGKAIVYQDKLHILGGGSGAYSDTNVTHHLNYHYSWDGETWKKESDLPYPAFGITPFVLNGALHIVGGESNSNINYGSHHYVWDGISWSKSVNLPDKRFNASIAKVSDTQVYLFGGLTNRSGGNVTAILKFDGVSWTTLSHTLPNCGFNDTTCSATVDVNGDVILVGNRILYYNPTSGLSLYHGTPVNLTEGDTVVYRNEVHMFQNKSHYKWSAKYGWIRVSTIPYDFVNGSAVVYNDKIHLIGSTSVGMEDYHYIWSPEDGWIAQLNLPWRYAKGSAVVYNGEIHLIGGIYLNNMAYNHYKLEGVKWVPVSHIYGDVIGARAATVFRGKLCVVKQLEVKKDSSTELTFRIDVFDGIEWREMVYNVDPSASIGEREETDIWTMDGESYYPQLLVYRDRLHVLALCRSATEDKNLLCHFALTNSDASGVYEEPSKIGYTGITSSTITTMLPLVYGNNIWAFTNTALTINGCIFYSQIDFDANNYALQIYLPEDHTFICNKNNFFPVIGEVEELENGYRALSTGEFVFGIPSSADVAYNEPFSVN